MIPEDCSLHPVRAAIVGWEKLRIAFNLFLLALGLILSWDLYPAFGGIHIYAFWAIIYGITVNAFYCLGPLTEIYLLTLAPARMPRTRMHAFVAGTVLALAVTAILAIDTRMSFHFEALARGM